MNPAEKKLADTVDAEMKEEKKVVLDQLCRADVVVQLTDRLYGSIPKNINLLTDWITAKAGKPIAEGGPVGDEDTLEEKIQSLALQPEDERADTTDVEDEAERVSCGFRMAADPITHVKFITMRDFQLKAALGVAGQSTKLTTKVRGARPVLREALQIRPQYIPLYRDGALLEKPDGEEDFIGHVTTMRGRRSILKRCDYVERATLRFSIFWVPGVVTHEHLEQLLVFTGSFLGIGSQRRFEAGKFDLLSYTPLKATFADLRPAHLK